MTLSTFQGISIFNFRNNLVQIGQNKCRKFKNTSLLPHFVVKRGSFEKRNLQIICDMWHEKTSQWKTTTVIYYKTEGKTIAQI